MGKLFPPQFSLAESGTGVETTVNDCFYHFLPGLGLAALTAYLSSLAHDPPGVGWREGGEGGKGVWCVVVTGYI